MRDHRGSDRATSRIPSRHSSQRFRHSSRSRSRSRSSERIRHEHNEHNQHNEHNERTSIHNNHGTHDSHNDHRTTSTTNSNNTYITPQGVGFTDPISSYRSARNTQHRSTYCPEDELFSGLLSYPTRTSSNPFSRGRKDDYYPNDRSGYYERRQRSGLNLPNPSSAGIGAIGLAAGALGGFLGGNALNNNGRSNRGVKRPAPSAPRPSTGNYTNYSERPYVSRYSQEEVREDIGRRELRRQNAPVDGRSWLVEERRSDNRDTERSNRDSRTSASNRPSEMDSGRSSRDTKPRPARSDWDHYRPSTSGTENTPPIRYQGDSIDLGRGFAHDDTYATSHPVGGPAREYRVDSAIKEASVNPYGTPSRKSSKCDSKSGSKRESKSKKESFSSKMSDGYGIPLDHFVAPSGAIPEPSTGSIPAHIKSGRAVDSNRSEATMPTALAYGGSGVGIDRLETWQDYMDPQGAGAGNVGGMDGMGGRMPEGVRLEKRPSRIGAFMGKLCSSARA